MNHRELENALLLRDSGELSETDCLLLEEALEKDPALAALAEENQILQAAGPLSSTLMVPPLPELNRERILHAAEKPKNKYLSRLLAVAALLVLGLGILPHFTRHLPPSQPLITAQIDPIRSDLQTEDPLLDRLDDLEYELSLWSNLEMGDPAFLENESDWAKILLSAEDTI
ncbi:hypothetical protein P0Y35_02470 [Kiritimatiellaeota bacterium B1221]|nr:hypothetical protein [Kiritimatiellaeota bacterium B1221]